MNKSQLFMLVLVIGCAGFWFFYDVKGKPAREKRETESKRVFPALKKDDLVNVTIANLSGKEAQKLNINYVGGKWVAEGPPPVQLADAQVGTAIKSLVDLQESKELTSTASPVPSGEQLSEYGLAKPSYRIEMKTKDGQTHDLIVGDETPEANGYYVQTSEKGPVYSVGSTFKEVLNTTVDKLRETSPLPVEPSKANKVTVTLDNGAKLEAQLKTPREKPAEDAPDNVQVTNLSEEWNLNAPEQAPADGNKVRDLLFSWKNLKAGRFLKPDEKIDFSKPKMRIEVNVDGHDKPQVLEIGPAVEVKKNMYYVHRLDPDETMVVEVKDDKTLAPTANSLRNRHLASFEVDQIKRIEAKIDSIELSGKKDDGSVWHLQKPAQLNSDAGQVSQAVTDLLWAVKNTEWTEVSKETKEFKPRATIQLFDKEDHPSGKILLGPVSGKGALVQLGDAKTIYQLADDPLEKWKAIAARTQPAAATPAPPATPATPAGK